MLLYVLCASVILHTEATRVMKDLKDIAALRKAVGFLYHSNVKRLKVLGAPPGKQ